MKILNLYAGIGGNRKLWGDEHDITAIEYREDIAAVYKKYFPNDNVIVCDAHQYLLENYKNFDFVWSSTPCPTHSRARFWGLNAENYDAVYPDMSLYQEIIFLKHHAKGKFVVENVVPYYEPIIEPTAKIGRHLFWTNFKIGQIETNDFKKDNLKYLEELHGFSLDDLKMKDKQKILRNCVEPELGKYILDCAMNIKPKQNLTMQDLFELE